jgi:hypothetical protein
MRLQAVNQRASREPMSAWPILTLAEPMSALAYFEYGEPMSAWPILALDPLVHSYLLWPVFRGQRCLALPGRADSFCQ